MISRSEPDVVIARTSMAELEAKMGIPPLEGLLAERDELVQQVARLRARHGSFGTWDAERKIALEQAAAVIRAQSALEQKKVTEAALDEAAHTTGNYVDFITASISEKADWIILENRIQGIEDTLLRANAIARYLSSEMMLTR